jgi:hypothetical protein
MPAQPEVTVTDLYRHAREALMRRNNELAVAYSLIELMAMHIPRDRMPAAERELLDSLLGRTTCRS